MKSSPFFYVLYTKDQFLRELLNALKIIAEPTTRTEAHITIRGPYFRNKLGYNHIKRYSETIKDEELKIKSVDNFFAFGQNTVFYKCNHNKNLEIIWKKFTYNEFTPHITIYDGEDRDFAIRLFDTLKNSFKPFTYKVEKVDFLEPKDISKLDIYRLKDSFNYPTLHQLVGTDLDFDDLQNFTSSKRLELISIISRKLYSHFE